MTDDPIDLAIGAARDILETVDPASAAAIVGSYAYPFDSDAWDQEFEAATLPVVICEQLVGVVESFDQIAGGRFVHNWSMQIRLLIRRGRINDNEHAREVAKVHNHYVRATLVTLAQNYTLNGTAQGIGGGPGGKFFDVSIGHVPFLDSTYWGARLLLPVRQTIEQATTP